MVVWFNFLTGVTISSNYVRIQFLFQRHNISVTDLLLKTLKQKVVTFSLWCFNKNRIREQLDGMRTPVNGKKLKHFNLLLTTLGMQQNKYCCVYFLSKPKCLIQVLISLFAHMLWMLKSISQDCQVYGNRASVCRCQLLE